MLLKLIKNYQNSLIKKSKHKKSGFYLNNYKKLSETLTLLEKDQQKTILIGASSALIHLANKYPQKLNHVIIMETGGTKGSEKEMIKEELHEILKKSFELNHIHSEYGMTSCYIIRCP